jgi:hypothetical protein
MRVPEYSLKQGLEYRDPTTQGDPIEFPAGTLIFPFWSEFNLPQHIREEFQKNTISKSGTVEIQNPFVMCIIGRLWIPVTRNNIRKSAW